MHRKVLHMTLSIHPKSHNKSSTKNPLFTLLNQWPRASMAQYSHTVKLVAEKPTPWWALILWTQF